MPNHNGGARVAINPEMIVVARESRGWTQRELASELGVSQATWSKYELGMLHIPDDVVNELAAKLNYEPEFFQQNQTLVGLAGDFLYRKKAHVTAKVRRRVQAEVNIRRMQVERLMRRADIVRDDLPFPAIQPEEMDGRIDRIAQEVRTIWRIPSGPVRNVTAHIENAGGVVFVVDFETDLIDGTNVRKPGEPPMLFVNSKVPGDRHRYNLAHELAHAVMHFGAAFDDAEDQANQFAAEFLMPRAIIRSDLRNLDLAGAAQLKVVWGVSMAAIIVRAHELGTITESTYRRLFTALNARGMRTREPLDVPFEKPVAFETLIQVHRESFQMNDAQLRKVLFTDRLGPQPLSQSSPNMKITGSLFN
jgi:Zn-dependent peptidase ImmA (M78 family)/transcriptional regulator with XRE-family HTH domain